MGARCVTIEKNTADYAPDDRRVSAALPGAVNGEDFAVFIKLIGDTEQGFQLILTFLESGSHDERHILVYAKFLAGDGGEGW